MPNITMKLAANSNISRCMTGYQSMLQTEFAAPVLRGRPVVVADAHCCHVQIIPPMFQGWAVARRIAPNAAIVIREADAPEREALLRQWPEVSLHICHVSDNGVLAVEEIDGLSRIVRVNLCDEAVETDDIVAARFDGRQFWFDRITARKTQVQLGQFVSDVDLLPDLSTATFAMTLPIRVEPLH